MSVLNGLTARDALCLLVGCMLTVLDEARSDDEREQSLDACIDLLRRCSGRFDALTGKHTSSRVAVDAPIQSAGLTH